MNDAGLLFSDLFQQSHDDSYHYEPTPFDPRCPHCHRTLRLVDLQCAWVCPDQVHCQYREPIT